MGKALVIKNVNFASVALDQVSFVGNKPCTALELSPASISFDTVGETKTITAIPTPADTTDVITWSSSNENVATVNDGAVTIHGLGEAIITATCGTVSESIEITQTELKMTAKYVANYYPDQISEQVPAATIFALSDQYVVGANYDGEENTMVNDGVSRGIGTALVPYGATKAKAHATGSSRPYGYIYKYDSENLTTYNGNNYPSYVGKATGNLDVDKTVEYGQSIMLRLDSVAESIDYFIFS